jgi:hypothetical protein
VLAVGETEALILRASAKKSNLFLASQPKIIALGPGIAGARKAQPGTGHCS